MANVVFDVAAFRAQFTAFADAVAYPDAMLQAFFGMATVFIKNDTCSSLGADGVPLALNYMVAHLVDLNNQILSGDVPGLVIQGKVDKADITLQPPPEKTQFQYWLNLSGYGAALLTLLGVKGVGGLFVGGLPEGAAFRKTYGVF